MTDSKTTDVLIIGAGAAGLSAAVAAHDSGAKVTVIEKGAKLGGTAAISGGIVWVPSNPNMQEKGILDSREDALAYFRSLDHGEMNDDSLEAFVDEGANAGGARGRVPEAAPRGSRVTPARPASRDVRRRR